MRIPDTSSLISLVDPEMKAAVTFIPSFILAFTAYE